EWRAHRAWRSVGAARSGAIVVIGLAPFAGTRWENAAALAHDNAPYLRRLMERRDDLLADVDEEWPSRLLREAIADGEGIAAEPRGIDEAMRALRRAKDATHLATAIADIARFWPLERVTRAITAFADVSLRAALAVAGRELVERGTISDAAAPG